VRSPYVLAGIHRHREPVCAAWPARFSVECARSGAGGAGRTEL